MAEHNGQAVAVAEPDENPLFYRPDLRYRLRPEMDRGRRRVVIEKASGDTIVDDFVDFRRQPERDALAKQIAKHPYVGRCFSRLDGEDSGINAQLHAREIVEHLAAQADAAETGLSLALATPLSAVEHVAPRWLVYPFAAIGHCTLFASQGGLGKSTQLVSLTMMGVRGDWRPLSHDPAEPCQVVWVCGEDPEAAWLRDALEGYGATADERALIHHVESVVDAFAERQPISLPRDADAVDRLVGELNTAKPDCPVRLVVVDTALSLAHGLNANDQGEVRGFMRTLRTLAQRCDAAVVVAHHFRKNAETIRAAITGSTAWIDDARLAYALAQDLDDERRRLVLHVKSNVRIARNFGFAWRLERDAVAWEDEPIDLTADKYDQLATEAKRRGARSAAPPEAIAELLVKAAMKHRADSPFTSGKLAAMAGKDYRTIQRGLQWLLDNNQAREVDRPQGRPGRGGTFYAIDVE